MNGDNYRASYSLTAAYKFTAVLGDLRHKETIYLRFGSASLTVVRRLLTNSEQAAYLKIRHPDLVPTPGPGEQPPSDHTLGTIFEYNYYTDPAFVKVYLDYLAGLVGCPRFGNFANCILTKPIAVSYQEHLANDCPNHYTGSW